MYGCGMIEQLKYLEAISVIEEVPTEGHSPLKIIANDYCQYYIKNTRGKKPDFNIINEFLCHYLLRLWQIPTPDIAAIKLVPDRLPDNLSQWHKKHYYNTITFGSKRVANSTELNMFIETQGKVELKKIANPEIIVKLGLFDIWVENTDRKPTNSNILLVSNSKLFEIWAIDNAFTFDSLSYNNLYMGITNTYDQNILYTDFARSIIKIYSKQQDWVESLREYFYICTKSCQQFYGEIVNNLPQELGFTDDLQEALKNFLFNETRNKQVFDEFLTRLLL
jgi:hypothetical protein